ncbi:MAG: aminotransferase class I/II-fold pyridoxal phosphate-dependent enzyme [Hyphomicrobiales bacterium]|nr:aminotransferase class I/II-fold pyridoxal phosphate-dependent enzyme [Hyphomicrobiales bacterium]
MSENASRSGANDRALSPRTLAVQAMGSVDPITKAIVMPLHMATTYVRDPDNQYRSGFSYARPHNATVREAEAVLSTLEGAAAALLFASGMAAISAVFQALEAGDHIVAPEVTYTGSRNWLRDEAKRRGLTFARVDTSDLRLLQEAVDAGPTKLVWLETPGNPLWTVTDIAAAAKITHAAGAKLGVDSTVATPVLTNPLALGADIVMHSATKYLNGHSDVLAGALAFAKRDALFERLETIRTIYGGVLGPFEAFLLIRGMRTLHVRVEAQCRTAMFLAENLASHIAVTRVLYPGLASHPNHDAARRQMRGGFSGMLSIAVRGGEARAIATAARVKVWKRATSLGGVESLIEHRASVEGEGTPCPPDVLRLSVGLEDPQDLLADLDQALTGE